MKNDRALTSIDDAREVLVALAWSCDNDGLYPMCDVPSREGCVKEWYELEAARFLSATKMLMPAKRYVCDCMCHDDSK